MLATFRSGEKIAGKVDILTNPYSKIEKGKRILTAEFLTQNGVDGALVKSDFNSKGPSYVFSNYNTEVILTNEETPQQAFERIGLIIHSSSGTY